MDENENFSNQLNLLLDHSYGPQQTNLFPLYNSNITGTTTHNDNLKSNMAAWGQQYLQPLAPMNNFAVSSTTGSNYPFMMPPESFPLPYYITSDHNSSHVPLHDPTNYFDAGDVHLLDPNWEAISAFLAGHVRPGTDVAQVYRCVVCNVEFANPQALGGHMSAHSKGRKKKEGLMMRSTKPTKFKKTETKKLKETKSFVKHSYS